MNRSGVRSVYLCLMVAAAAAAQLYWLRTWQGGVPAPPGRADPVGPIGLMAPQAVGMPLLFLALGVVAQHFPIAIAPKRKVDVSVAVYFASLLLLGPPLAVALVGLSHLLGQLTLALRRNPVTGKRMRTPKSALFNTAQAMLATGLAGAALYAFVPHEAPAPLDRWGSVAALVASAAVLYLANSLAVASMAGLQMGRNPLAVWAQGRGRTVLETAGLFLIGAVVARAGARDPLLVLAMTLPAAIIYWSMDRMVRVEELARREAEHAAWRDLERMKTEFMQSLSHELRAPLSLVVGFSELLHQQVAGRPDQSDADAAQFAGQIHANALLLARLLDDLLDFSRIERGEIVIQPENVDLVPVLQELVSGMRRQPGGGRLTCVLPQSLPAHADPARVAQVVYNLLVNAQKYAPNGPITVRATLAARFADSASAYGQPGTVRLEVEDQGPGIPPEEQPRVWQKFYRGEAVRGLNVVQGTGVGLAIVKTLVEAQGGRVGLESASGRGSRFWIELPAAEPDVQLDRPRLTAQLARLPADPGASA